MEAQIERLVDKTWSKYLKLSEGERLLIGVGGIPGSGKTTLAETVTKRLQQRIEKDSPSWPGGPAAMSLPMDGFHYTRATLSAMSDPENAHARRGAAFTFDAAGYLALIAEIRANTRGDVWAPSFDHAVKDPKERDYRISERIRVVIVEGLYVALDEPVWREAGAIFDELWFVEVDLEVARRRLRERHVRAGISKTIEEGDRRAVENDLVNGKQILDNRLPLAEVLQSVEDEGWVHE